MDDQQARNSIAQWAFDTRPILGRFHLWLEDVDVEWEQGEYNPDYAFPPRGIRRCLVMATAATSLGTKLFGSYGAGKGQSKGRTNQAKKGADAVAAYVLSEALWHTTRGLPENHAMMVCLGEGLMPKAGESPEMGSNPLLGFGRVYARPEVAKFIDRRVVRLLNQPGYDWDTFYRTMKERGIKIWGAAIDTLENTTRFAKGEATGPMSVLHVFDQPLTMSRTYESYMGLLAVPLEVKRTAERTSTLLDFLTPRTRVVEAVEQTYPGIRREHIHIWTLSGKARAGRIGTLWEEWRSLGVHLVEDGWDTPAGVPAFTDSGTYAPTYLVGNWKDGDGNPHVFMIDGYAASAEALQAASLSDALDVDVTLGLLSPQFKLPYDQEYKLMKLNPDAPDFGLQVGQLYGKEGVDEKIVAQVADAIRDARDSNVAVHRRVLRADDFFPEKNWRVLASVGYMCPDPYTGTEGVTQVGHTLYRVTSRLASHNASVRCTFLFRLMETFEQSRLVFSPLLVRFTSGMDHRLRSVKVSDSGRIRNELQTMMSQALEYDGDKICVHFDRIDESIMPADKHKIIREVLEWYRREHPVWFKWLEVV